jgi:tRNA A37 threonylcarbamoyladenosine dehydratase
VVADHGRVDIHVGLWRKEDSLHLLDGADWVVDAIDNIDTKVDLLAHCALNKIPVFSSMGSGAKQDPTRIQIAYVSHQLRAGGSGTDEQRHFPNL